MPPSLLEPPNGPPSSPKPGKNDSSDTWFPPLRNDLKVVHHVYAEEDFAVIRDPVSAEFTRVPWRDYELVSQITQSMKLKDVAAMWETRFPELRLQFSQTELIKKAAAMRQRFLMGQLCRIPGQQVVKLHQRKESQKKKGRTTRGLLSWIRIYRSLNDPERFLVWLTPKVSFVFTRWFSFLVVLYVTFAAYLAFENREQFGFELGWFFSPTNLISLILVMLGIKMLHEIGHGVTCKHFGGEIHEAGVMFIFFNPLLYVNTTDAWLFPNKYHRMAVSAAGIYVEILFAALLVPIWVILHPGLLKEILMQAIIVASVGTVLVNANPLIKFDGYFILSDWLEIPNLRRKATRVLRAWVRRWVLGPQASPPPSGINPRQRRSLIIYAIVSSLYIVFIFSALFSRLDDFLNSVGLRVIAMVLAGAFLTAMVVLPLIRLIKDVLTSKIKGWNQARPYVISLALVGLIWLVLSLPINRTVDRSAVVDVFNAETLRAETPGFLDETLVKEGSQVLPGQVLAKLRNPDLSMELALLRHEESQIQARLRMANYRRMPEGYRRLQTSLEGVQTRIQEKTKALQALELKASMEGIVVTRNLQDLLGQFYEAGDPVITIVPQDAFDVLVPVTEKEARLVHTGADVQMRVRTDPDRTYSGKVAQEPLASLEGRMPASLSQKRGGDIYTTMDSVGHEEAIEDQWYALVELSESSPLLRPGTTGVVRIECGRESIGQLFKEKILDFFKVDYRL